MDVLKELLNEFAVFKRFSDDDDSFDQNEFMNDDSMDNDDNQDDEFTLSFGNDGVEVDTMEHNPATCPCPCHKHDHNDDDRYDSIENDENIEIIEPENDDNEDFNLDDNDSEESKYKFF